MSLTADERWVTWMPRRTETQGLTGEAKALYQDGKRVLLEREQWNAATQAVLRSACQWAQEAQELGKKIQQAARAQDGEAMTPTRLRGLMRSKSLCDGEMRRNLDDLLLLPQRPRGRPAGSGDEADEDDDIQSAWDAFDETDGGGAP